MLEGLELVELEGAVKPGANGSRLGEGELMELAAVLAEQPEPVRDRAPRTRQGARGLAHGHLGDEQPEQLQMQRGLLEPVVQAKALE